MHPNPTHPESTPHLNALKHGLRAVTVLLPGEDAEEFQALRQDLFELHKPRTRTEARCVEAMVEHEWSMARCRRIRDRYQGRLLGLVEGTGETHCEKDPHRWHHSAMDCSLDERRIAKLIDWQLERLTVLQKLRQQRLIATLEQEDALAPADARNPASETRNHPSPGSRNVKPAIDSRDEGNRKTSERTGASGTAPAPGAPARPASTAPAEGEYGKFAQPMPPLPPAGAAPRAADPRGGGTLEAQGAVA